MNTTTQQTALRRAAILLLTAALMMLLLSFISLYSDDYEYALFFRDGLRGFVEKTLTHIRTSNGRTFIHFVAEVFLVFGTTLYAVLFPLMMAGGLAVAAAAQSATREAGEAAHIRWGRAALIAALSMLMILALPVDYLNQTLCWVAGSFNYCFPPLMLFCFLFGMQKQLAAPDSRKWLILASVLGFLTGATTEQTGAGAIMASGALLCCFWLGRRREGKKPAWPAALPVAATVLGYATVMLSPGTSARVSADASGSAIALLFDPPRLYTRFGLLTQYFSGEQGLLPLLLVLMLCLGGVGLMRREHKVGRWLALGLPAIGLALFLRQGGFPVCASLVVCLYLCGAAVLLCFLPEHRMSGAILGGGMISLLVMLFTSLDAFRTMVPAVICCIAVLTALLPLMLRQLPHRFMGWISLGLVVVICVVSGYPTYVGYAENHALIEQNDISVEQGKVNGAIFLSTNIDLPYRHTMMYENNHFFNQYVKYKQIPETCRIFFEGDHYMHYPVTVNGLPLNEHGYAHSGAFYLPINETCEALGITIGWATEGNVGVYLFTQNGVTYRLPRDNRALVYDMAGNVVADEAYILDLGGKSYFVLNTFSEVFGVKTEFDWAIAKVTG